MQFEHLQYFIVLCEQRSISKAAERLNISSQALGSAMRHLEEKLDLKLFVRTYRGVEPTAAGREIEKITGIYLRECAKLQAKYDIKEAETERVCIASVPYVVHNLLPKILPKFYRQYPNIQLLVQEKDIQDILADLNNGEAAFAFYIRLLSKVKQAIVLPEAVHFETFMEGRLMVYVPEKWAIAQQKIDLITLFQYPIIVPKWDDLYEFFALSTQDASSVPKSISVENYYVIREMVEEGNCGILAVDWPNKMHNLTYEWEHVVSLEIPSDVVVQFGYLKLLQGQLTPVAQKLVDFLFEQYGQP